jgi:DNA-directed RNA polymerase subunit K/omega
MNETEEDFDDVYEEESTEQAALKSSNGIDKSKESEVDQSSVTSERDSDEESDDGLSLTEDPEDPDDTEDPEDPEDTEDPEDLEGPKKSAAVGDADSVELDDNDLLIVESEVDLPGITSGPRRIPDEERVSKPFMSEFEIARVLGTRASQLARGCKSMILLKNASSHMEIAREELRLRKIPYRLIRRYPNEMFEVWRLDELQIF